MYIRLNNIEKDRLKLKNIYPKWYKSDIYIIDDKYREDIIKLFPNKKDDIDSLTYSFDILKKKDEIDKDIKEISLRKPRSHQIEMTKRALFYRRFALFCEMGTGKTQAIINTWQMLRSKGLVKKALVICPLSVIDSWVNEVKEVAGDDVFVLPILGTKKTREKLIRVEADMYIINYEGVLVLQDYFSVYGRSYDMVVLDESSKIKNHQAKRTKLILNSFKDVTYRYILSGTPLTQNILDLYPQIKFLAPGLVEKSFYSFRNHYCIMGGYGGYEVVGYKNLGELKRKVASISIQLKKEDCVDLPDKIYTYRLLDMSKKMEEQYKQMSNELVLQISEDESLTAQIILTKLLRLQQIISGVYVEDKENNKLKETIDIVEENIGNGNQIIIWARFIDTIHKLQKSLEKYEPAILYGAMSLDDRTEAINKFQKGKSKIFIGQVSTGGMGITLTAGNIVIYYENTFSLQDRIQSEARSHRIGQRRKVTYVDLLYRDTIDIHIYNTIKKKGDIAKSLVNSFKFEMNKIRR